MEPLVALDGGDAASRSLRVADGTPLHCLHWPAPAQASAALVFTHGIASHAGWFGETAAELAAAGIAVYGPDRRGSGRSGGRRGHLAGYEQAIADLDLVLELAAAELPAGAPVFLAGSSWAAKLALVAAARAEPKAAGLLLLGPGMFPVVSLPPAQFLAVLAGHLVAPTATLPIPLTPELYTPNPAYVAAIRADRLRLLRATTSFYWATARLDRARAAASARLRLPLLLLQGQADAMMDVAATRAWFDALGAPDATYVGYPGAGHTLDFEPERGRYLSDLRTWLAERCRG
jgi:acylglycerol lipase